MVGKINVRQNGYEQAVNNYRLSLISHTCVITDVSNVLLLFDKSI